MTGWRKKQIENLKAGSEIMEGDGGYGIGTREAYDEFVKKRNYKIGYSDCDCGCNIPVASNPEAMLRFLAYRMEDAGVGEAVAAIYARDIRKILDEFYGGAEK